MQQTQPHTHTHTFTEHTVITNTLMHTGREPGLESRHRHKASQASTSARYLLCVCVRQMEREERMYVNNRATTYYEADEGEHLSHQVLISRIQPTAGTKGH